MNILGLSIGIQQHHYTHIATAARAEFIRQQFIHTDCDGKRSMYVYIRLPISTFFKCSIGRARIFRIGITV